MIGEQLIAIYQPKFQDDWYQVVTDGGKYELRVGLFVGSEDERDPSLKMEIEGAGQKITQIKTNDFSLYIELENGSCILHVESYITASGDMYFEIQYWNEEQFALEKKDWYNNDPDIKDLKM